MEKQPFAFAFINECYPEWSTLGNEFEKLLFTDREAALLKARKLAELLISEVYEKEEIEYPQFSNQAERLMKLKNEGVLDDEMFRLFDRIRRIGNTAVHTSKSIPLDDALKIHKNLYTILRWFMESYISFHIQVPEYQDPEPENIDDRLIKLIKEYGTNPIQETSSHSNEAVDTMAIKESSTVEEELPTMYGSHLLFQLSKLRESSQFAVEGHKGLSEFKQYLHVTRPIEEKLENYLREAIQSSKSQLIFLCGSVGDGKSHLLSYLSTTIPEIMEQFKIHSDATESFDPKKNSLDTLAEVLEAFSDDMLSNSNEKRILAINLGVLNNFIESHYAEEKYQTLKEYILSAHVFQSHTITKIAENDHFKLVNFADYNTFELTANGPISTYMKQLFQRITSKDDCNPFYKAYQLDKEKNLNNPLLINYEMFSSESVQNQIIQLIIKTITKEKVIISSRALLNFIYDILVPNNSEAMETTDFIDMLPNLLPNLLFEGTERSIFLRQIAHHDPIHQRIKEVDEKLIRLNNAGSYYVFFRDVIYEDTAQAWIQLLEPIENVAFLDKDTKRELSELFIRSVFLYESHLKSCFHDNVYINYMKFLYAYNTDKIAMLQQLYYEIEKAVYLWKGSPKLHYLYLDEEGSNIRIAEPIQLKPAPKTITNEQSAVVERFTPTLFLAFTCDSEKKIIHEIEIDFPLYMMVTKVLKGYRLNKKDREDSIQFIDFIEKLLPYGRQNEEIMIKDLEHSLTFTLEYNPDFGSYTFSKEQ